MDKYKKLGKNTLIVFLGNVGSKLINIIMLPIFTHWLSPEEYGTTDIIITYSSLMLSIVAMCIYDAIFVIPKRSNDEEKTSFFTTGWMFSIITFSFTGFLCFLIIFLWTGSSNIVVEYLPYLFFLVFTSFLQTYTQSFTKAIDKMTVYCLTGIINTASVAIFAVILIPSFGVKGYLLSIIIAYLISAVYSFVASKSYKFIRFGSVKKESLIRLLKYSIPLIPNSLMFWFVNGMNRPLIAEYVGLDANGILAVANKIPGVISTLFLVFSNAWAISLLEEYGKSGFTHFFNMAVRCVMLPSVIVACILGTFSKEIIVVLADDAYIEAYKYVPLAMIGSILSGLSGTVGGIFSAKEQSKFFFYSSVWGAIASVLFMYALIPLLHLYGAVIASALSYFVIVIVRFIYAKKDIIGFSYNSMILMLVGLLLISLIIYLDLNNFLRISLGLFVTLLLMVANKDILSTIYKRLISTIKVKNTND